MLLHPVAAIAELKRWFPEYRENPQITIDNRSVILGDVSSTRAALAAIHQARSEAVGGQLVARIPDPEHDVRE